MPVGLDVSLRPPFSSNMLHSKVGPRTLNVLVQWLPATIPRGKDDPPPEAHPLPRSFVRIGLLQASEH